MILAIVCDPVNERACAYDFGQDIRVQRTCMIASTNMRFSEGNEGSHLPTYGIHKDAFFG